MEVKWQIQFRNFQHVALTVNIYDLEYTGTPIQLIGAANPFTTDEDNDDDPFTPVRTQTGYVRFICEDIDIVKEILPTNITDRPITIEDGNHNILWQGFIDNSLYTQSWEAPPTEIELPIVSVLEAMYAIPFTQSGGFTRMLDLFDAIPNLPTQPSIIVPTTNKRIYTDAYACNEAFQSRIEAPARHDMNSLRLYETMTLGNILAEWCKFYGVTAHEDGSRVIFTAPGVTAYQEALTTSNKNSIIRNLSSLKIMGCNNTRSFLRSYRTISGKFSAGETPDIVKFGDFAHDFSYYATDQYTLKGTWIFSDYDSAVKCYYYNGSMIPRADLFTVDITRDSVTTAQGGQVSSGVFDSSNIEDGFSIRCHANVNEGFPALSFKNVWPIYLQPHLGDDSSEYLQKVRISWDMYRRDINGEINWEPYGIGTIGLFPVKIRSGNKYLTSSGAWSTTEQTVMLTFRNGSLEDSSYDGEPFEITLPATTDAIYDLEVTLMMPTIPYDTAWRIKNVHIEIINNPRRQVFVRSADENSYHYNSDINAIDTYNVECMLTTCRQSVLGLSSQVGIGVIRDLHGKIYANSIRLESLGMSRRNNILKKTREVISLDIEGSINPQDVIAINGINYCVMSQSKNWRDNINRISIMQTD